MTQPPGFGRRGFFRTVAKDIVQTAEVALEVAASVSLAASEPASPIHPASPEGAPLTAEVPAAQVAERAPSAPSAIVRPFRVEGDVLLVVDERRLPDAVIEIECRSPIEVAREIRRRTLPGGTVPGQAAAMSLALAASEMRAYLPTVRTAILRIRADGLVNARPLSRHLQVAVERVMAVYEAAAATEDDGAVIAAAVREEAEAICREAAAAEALIGERLVGHLPEVGDRPVVALADATGVPFLVAGARVRNVSVHVTDGGPERRGARIGAGLLAQAGLDHAVIADAAVGWLLGTGKIDAVVVGAERITATGDTINDMGTYPLAVLAARHRVPFLVCGAASVHGRPRPRTPCGFGFGPRRRSADGRSPEPDPRDEVIPRLTVHRQRIAQAEDVERGAGTR